MLTKSFCVASVPGWVQWPSPSSQYEEAVAVLGSLAWTRADRARVPGQMQLVPLISTNQRPGLRGSGQWARSIRVSCPCLGPGETLGPDPRAGTALRLDRDGGDPTRVQWLLIKIRNWSKLLLTKWDKVTSFKRVKNKKINVTPRLRVEQAGQYLDAVASGWHRVRGGGAS